MTLPTAVNPTVKTPGFWLSVNLLAATAGPGTATMRALIVAPISSTGNLTPNTELRQFNGAEDAKTAYGTRSQGYFTAKRLFENYGLANVKGVGAAPSAGVAASGTFVAAGPATSDGSHILTIAGREIEVPFFNGEASTVYAPRVRDYINQQIDNLPASATAAASTATVTAPYAGVWGNDIKISSRLKSGTGMTLTPSGAALAGGTLEPDFSAALTTVNVEEFDIIVPCLSNAEALAASGGAENLGTHIDTFNNGLNALLQLGIIGCTAGLSSSKTGAIARNQEFLQYAYGMEFQSLPCEMAGAEAGDQLRWHQQRPNYNRIRNRILGLYGPLNKAADKPTPTEIEDALRNGLSIYDFNAQTGDIYVVRPITTHSQDTVGAPDYRCYDISDVHGAYSVARDLRSYLPQEFPNASITEDLPDNGDPLPPGVVELRDVLESVISRLHMQARRGVVNRAKLDEVIANEELAIEIDGTDDTQVNIFIPFKIIKPLAKFSVVMNKVA